MGAGAGVSAELDRRLMAAALRIGRRNLGRTHPNPAVGAIVARVEDGNAIVVGRGWTAPGGRPHAETVALEQAGEAARGATVYVTLEPCAHDGKTPPCASALKSAGVARVVMAIEDPDPRVAGKGRAMLEEAGITVDSGVLADVARRDHAGHISRVTRGRPQVTLKLAVSADGMIGRREGERMMITGKPALTAVQTMRAESDAVMIGIGTVLVDDPRLTVRLPGLEPRSPMRIVLDPSARLPLDTKLVTTAGDVPVLVVVGPAAGADAKAALTAAGVKVIETTDGPNGLNLPEALAELAREGLTRILVEGGARVAASLLADDLLDEIILFRAPVVVGPDGVRALEGYALSAIERSPRFRQIDAAIVGDDQMRRYVRA
ncbi:MAG: bifunctional diaminohydroxyphosphoribosylaminopyrimidine deaminase/5-amino-6-(5-phosphoribosylamino)uracil reductase RibD [Bauldia sp.]|uniref:bifunctional diaminohydroxyphosphoribosylaminopyrimidine deaminase/5-amino-6-(5-phosphoribosylamino)uracil reductase RibD n=1 Tax=Bauldia sp. TaxID=2575872 RepID=UPI001DF867FE|nr:bifunctional diaminohydroxyphosphoribosylaminopyrimidine deaminase/5-amino-6-(5-phosphoribosylamino)uracil reductase RibD [Bauldia sp.]MCB1497287.1 bifunctional diaminohydroxyphosphoribosylaminopyrimidine deaminase/5-amino-6-(5-phosphoribosylamino)uracil reductase RibD [Bauldia sp.]